MYAIRSYYDPGDNQSDERTDHVNLAVGEIDQLDDAVHHGVAQGDERVDAPPGQPAEE